MAQQHVTIATEPRTSQSHEDQQQQQRQQRSHDLDDEDDPQQHVTIATEPRTSQSHEDQQQQQQQQQRQSHDLDDEDDPQQRISTSYNTPHQSPPQQSPPTHDQNHHNNQNQSAPTDSKPPRPSLPQQTHVIKLPVDQVHRAPPTQHNASTSGDHDQDPTGTYVIPLPIDQVYRVPPHRTAAIAAAAAADQERQENAEAAAASSSSFITFTEDKITFVLTCLWIFFFLLFLLLLLFVVLGIIFLILKPQNPKFNLHNFTFKNSTSLSTPINYIAHMNTTNPNGHIGFFYEQGSVAYMTCAGHEVARGKPPAFYHGKNTTERFDVKLWAERKLPKEIVRDMEASDSKMEVPLVLYMNIVLKLRLWSLDIFRIKMYVNCSFAVVGSEKFTPEKCTVEIDF